MSIVRLFLVVLFYPQIYYSFLSRGKGPKPYSYLYSIMTETNIKTTNQISPGYDHRPPTFGMTHEDEINTEIRQLMQIRKYFQQKKVLYELTNDRNTLPTKQNIMHRAIYTNLLSSRYVIHSPNIRAGGLLEDWTELL